MTIVIMSDPESHLGPWVVSAGKAHRCSDNTMHHSKNQWFQHEKMNNTKEWPAISRAHAVPGYGLGSCVMNPGAWQQLLFKSQEKMLAVNYRACGKASDVHSSSPQSSICLFFLYQFILVDTYPSSSSLPYDCFYFVAHTVSIFSYVQNKCFLTESKAFCFTINEKNEELLGYFNTMPFVVNFEWSNMF